MTTAFHTILLVVLFFSGIETVGTNNGNWRDHSARVAIFAVAGALFIASMIYL